MSVIFRCWDSVCALGYLNKESDKFDKCERVLEKAEQGEIIIVVSSDGYLLGLSDTIMLNNGREKLIICEPDILKQNYLF